VRGLLDGFQCLQGIFGRNQLLQEDGGLARVGRIDEVDGDGHSICAGEIFGDGLIVVGEVRSDEEDIKFCQAVEDTLIREDTLLI